MISCRPGLRAAAGRRQQLRRPRTGGHIERDQGPVPVRVQGCEDSLISSSGTLRGIRDGTAGRYKPLRRDGRPPSDCGAHTRAPPGATGPAGTDSPAGPARHQVEVIKAAQHRSLYARTDGAYTSPEGTTGAAIPGRSRSRQCGRAGLPASCSHRKNPGHRTGSPHPTPPRQPTRTGTSAADPCHTNGRSAQPVQQPAGARSMPPQHQRLPGSHRPAGRAPTCRRWRRVRPANGTTNPATSMPGSPCPVMTGASKPAHASTSAELHKLPPLFS